MSMGIRTETHSLQNMLDNAIKVAVEKQSNILNVVRLMEAKHERNE
jgi:hypothetical protein